MSLRTRLARIFKSRNLRHCVECAVIGALFMWFVLWGLYLMAEGFMMAVYPDYIPFGPWLERP